jgi:hypothetical protein
VDIRAHQCASECNQRTSEARQKPARERQKYVSVQQHFYGKSFLLQQLHAEARNQKLEIRNKLQKGKIQKVNGKGVESPSAMILMTGR